MSCEPSAAALLVEIADRSSSRAVRKFDSPHEMEKLLATHVHPAAPYIVMREEIEADHVEETA